MSRLGDDRLYKLTENRFIYIERDGLGWYYTLYDGNGLALDGDRVIGVIDDDIDNVVRRTVTQLGYSTDMVQRATISLKDLLL